MADALLIAHLTDLHVVAPPTLCYGMVDTRAFLARAVRRLNTLDPRPDLVVVTGDLVDEPTAEAYGCLRDLLAAIDIPLVVLPGNHDDRALLARTFSEHDYLPRDGAKAHFVLPLGELRLVAFDAVTPGQEHARITQVDLEWLDGALAETAGHPVMMLMHHPPMPTGLGFMDAMQPALPPAFEAVIARHANVKLIVCGHIHRAMDGMFGGARVAVAPSTAHQFVLAFDPMTPPRLSLEPPLLRLHHWRGGDVISFTTPVDPDHLTQAFPGVDAESWPEMVHRMREGASRAAVYPSEMKAPK
ncbi:3',5'-cyclic adenosine monophosphate phosphodiesterase CpdA [Brevundimonas sp. SH203]|uniref:phosphodiesterase n=1 Tax=Brevundimonas sp. SH203 TaxID=345167 RepID=UPI0009D50A86|nr:phosphodiesterase [Brevundimonas sp. SH203]GAW40612.1 3',5'-cyclic adenosine monophosphate phosphodiesterase CpdA [Brevundimonas sp. SH203]